MDQTIKQYCVENTLLIPQALDSLSDAHRVLSEGEAAIYHKLICGNMRDIEFYTSAPCLAFVLRGRETFTTHDHDEIILNSHEMLFMPRHLYMISDFVNDEGPLEAFLFFFDPAVIDEFLRSPRQNHTSRAQNTPPYKIRANDAISAYMLALHKVYRDIDGTAALLRLKLLELLHLIDALDDSARLRGFLTAARSGAARRNIGHLMKDPRLYRLNIRDFAELSGRSLSSFTRDFKRLYGTTPGQWLINARLERAYQLINETDKSVTEISLDVGYENISHFISAYKVKYGLTPKKSRPGIF